MLKERRKKKINIQIIKKFGTKKNRTESKIGQKGTVPLIFSVL